jgi:hypothetical protein
MQASTHARMQAYTNASLCSCRHAFTGVFAPKILRSCDPAILRSCDPAILRSCDPAILRSCDPAISFRLFAHTFVRLISFSFSLPVCMHAFMCACIFTCAGMWPRALERVPRTRVSALMPIYCRYECVSACEGMWCAYASGMCVRAV